MITPPQPSGAIAVIETQSSGAYYFLTPVIPDRVNPAIWIPGGHGLPWHRAPKALGLPRKGVPGTFGVPRFVVPGKIAGITDQLLVTPRGTSSQLAKSADRWIGAFTAALKIMNQVWKSTCPEKDAPMALQEWIANGLTESIVTADYVLKQSGCMNQKGMPQNSESYFITMMVLIHWGGLWRLRKEKIRHDELDAAPGFLAMDGAAEELTRICLWCFHDWEALGWGSISKKKLAKIQEMHFLEGKLL